MEVEEEEKYSGIELFWHLKVILRIWDFFPEAVQSLVKGMRTI